MITLSVEPRGGYAPKIEYDGRANRLFVDGQEVISQIPPHVIPPHARIIMGTKCNYNCSYCLQGPNTQGPNPDIKGFVDDLARYFCDVPLHHVILEGGESLFYFEQQMQRLIAELRQNWPSLVVYTFTNGSTFTKEIAQWCVDNGVIVQLSHDGPGQAMRGVDPLDDPAILEAFKWYVDQAGFLQFCPGLTKHNPSQKKHKEYMEEKLQLEEGQYRIMTMSPLHVGNASIMDSCPDQDDLETWADTMYEESVSRPEDWQNLGRLTRMTRDFKAYLGKQWPTYCHAICKEVELITDTYGNGLHCGFKNVNDVDPNTGLSCSWGNIKGHHISEKQNAPIDAWWENRISNSGECPMTQMCDGVCPYGPDEFYLRSCRMRYYFCTVALKLAIYEITGFTVTGIDFDIDKHQERCYGKTARHTRS